MSRIRLLSESTVNRIAAGEVIERPAAATKELVENALDAGATRIVVCLDGGGIDRLEVTDNGIGMSAEELELCVLRHATSKLTDETLVRITTLGFRGEALPSIGAAARLSITSRPGAADHACAITVEGGHVSAVAPSSGSTGTRVVVRDLFFATPARRKFLKSPRIEGDHAEAVVRRLALSAPGVAFRLELDGRVVFEAPAQPRIERVAALLGRDEASVMLPIDEERGGLRISGYICSPAVTRATPVAQTLVVNNRPVADPVLRTAVKVAYRDVIAAGRHAIVALYLDVPPDDLDVNVHPAKTELRFRDAGAVRSLVIGSVRRALGVGTGQVVPMPSGAASWGRPVRPSYPAPPLSLSSGSLSPGGVPRGNLAEAQLPFMSGPAARQIAAVEPSPDYPLGAPVAQVLDTYIIAVASDGSLVLVDQHAAHERLTHEAIREQVLDGVVRSQPLLLPAVVDLPPADVARLVARATDLAGLGLELEEFGAGAILVRALPAVLGASEPGPLLRDLADEFADMDEETVLSARLDAVIARMACHGSIRAGRKLGQAEMSALLRQMEATPRAATCSHGRPTVLKLSKMDIEKMFGRR
ncbi:DNA mismatch repair endonuclease MutL [Acidisphaera sp. S103]|uniref:DNA mismatch repair endonuclease MutL n=1 Tax=Acidisphaera sp. S103 TaxID=1747223 RepID=UPI00131C0F9D|nr:DNA mismatch repair endonuclease MutL [Acidisphaera sp. S103]